MRHLTIRSFIRDENAVNIVMGYILNFTVLMVITFVISGTFYLLTEDHSQHSMRVGFSDLGNQIARDITNMYMVSEHSPNNISSVIEREIPLKIGGENYRIELKNATNSSMASVEITEDGFSGYKASTMLNSIDFNSNVSGVVYSGSGEMTIGMTKNNTGSVVWIK